jgi:ornithine cyclodeaminase
VVEAAWIAPGTHVSTLGPRTTSRHELPVELLERAHVVLTDSPVQEAAYGEPNIFPPDRMVHLGAALAGAVPARTGSDDITVFCSAGLAGTEVAVAAALARRVTDANGR